MTSPNAVPSDEELMIAYAGGDEEAFVLLFKRYKLRIFNFFLRHLGDRVRAEDLFQTTFLKLHRQRKSYQPTAAFSTWIFTIATNLLRDSALSARRHANVVELDEVRDKVAMAGGLVESIATSDKKDPEAEYAQREIASYLRQAVQSLPLDQREVILLAKYEGFKYEEIAGILNTTAGAVKIKAHRAMKTLEKVLKDRLGVPPLYATTSS